MDKRLIMNLPSTRRSAILAEHGLKLGAAAPHNLQRFIDAQHPIYGQVEEIFGSPDHLKFHSSITLFAQSQPSDNLFAAVLAKYFHGELDRRTLEQL